MNVPIGQTLQPRQLKDERLAMPKPFQISRKVIRKRISGQHRYRNLAPNVLQIVHTFSFDILLKKPVPRLFDSMIQNHLRQTSGLFWLKYWMELPRRCKDE